MPLALDLQLEGLSFCGSTEGTPDLDGTMTPGVCRRHVNFLSFCGSHHICASNLSDYVY